MALLEPCLDEEDEDEDEEVGEVKEEDQKSLSVAIIGAPNAGKSALTNFMVETKVSAVSRKINTTTYELLGVLTKGDTQILNDSELLKKIPSKSCPLRCGRTKIQEDSLSLFHTGLREYIGMYNVKTKGSSQHEWAITGFSVSASKIVAIPSGSITKYFHNKDQNCTSRKESDYVFTNDAASLSSSGSI